MSSRTRELPELVPKSKVPLRKGEKCHQVLCRTGGHPQPEKSEGKEVGPNADERRKIENDSCADNGGRAERVCAREKGG